MRLRAIDRVRSIHIVLRSVFRALRQEGVVFCDPTRGLVFSGVNETSPSVPSDRLPGVLGCGSGGSATLTTFAE